MFERVTYADLQFAGRKVLEKGRGEEPEEGELTYENIQGSRAQEEPPRTGQGAKGQSFPREAPLRAEGPAVAQRIKPQKQQPAASTQSALVSGHQGSAGWSPRTRWAALGVLGIGLFLLSVIVSLGVRYTQASWQLQQASRDHAAEHHTLQAGLEESQHLLRLTKQELNSTKQELTSTKQELTSTKQELNSTMVALWHSWAAENWTQQQLQHQELLVDQANHNLALLQRERASLETSLSHASSCQQIGCCPPGWKLFRWKCLRISHRAKDWEASQRDCEAASSQLLILKKPWAAHEVWPSVSSEQSNQYWIGLKKSWSSFRWVDQSPGLGTWVSPNSREPYTKKGCVALHEGVLNWHPCDEKKKFICEVFAMKGTG
ncbi:hypothetical protein E2320_017959 [Naja naja]|nr:hypothetical protein E2320_017959 [Naja naja]